MTSKIKKDSVVSFHYTLRGDDKNIIDTSSGHDPLIYLHGHGQIIPGLEKALVGKTIGDKLSVEVEPDQGYGVYDADLKVTLERKLFPADADVKVGSMFELSNEQGQPIIVRISGVEGEQVTVDGNHELAGKKLFFEVEVVIVRPATKSELEHGHAHSGDGHHH